MMDDQVELLRRLFAAAAELVEVAHDATIAGQAPRLAAKSYADAARRLRAKARDLAALAEVALIVSSRSSSQSRNKRKPGR